MSDSLLSNLDQWPAQRDQRIELGDDLNASRAVDHFAFFRGRKRAAHASKELEAHGFGVVLEHSLFRTSMTASRTEPLTDSGVEAFLSLVIPIVEKSGGVYDGFGSPVVG